MTLLRIPTESVEKGECGVVWCGDERVSDV